MNRGVELVGLLLAERDDLVHLVERRRHHLGLRRNRQTADPPPAPSRDRRCRPSCPCRRVHRLFVAVDDAAVKRVFANGLALARRDPTRRPLVSLLVNSASPPCGP
jgi:hypothetical protein